MPAAPYRFHTARGHAFETWNSSDGNFHTVIRYVGALDILATFDFEPATRLIRFRVTGEGDGELELEEPAATNAASIMGTELLAGLVYSQVRRELAVHREAATVKGGLDTIGPVDTLDELGCDEFHDLDEDPCFRSCCDLHDECFFDCGCSAKSWYVIHFGAFTCCGRCNIKVSTCFLYCSLTTQAVQPYDLLRMAIESASQQGAIRPAVAAGLLEQVSQLKQAVLEDRITEACGILAGLTNKVQGLSKGTQPQINAGAAGILGTMLDWYREQLECT